ncbi:MAG: glycosyltransferase [Sporocytophaga sp.]|uniref:glycosyltransferase n=1 Tax=Sporocytophaga sp. TaxID=2231183 RepID=UPI001B1628B5|nr:glycosyltransferase [Sporocytophaga sp.]MBO9701045.1 glycosyltransferase [Sporocytophaga sp.]
MLKDQNIICLGNNMWESNFTNTMAEIMTVLSSENKVLHVDYAFSFKDFLRGPKAIPFKKILGFEPRLREVKTRVSSTINVLSPPPVLPINMIPSHPLFLKLLRVNARIVESEIKRAVQQLKIKDPIIVSGFNPYYGTMLAGRLDEILNIYYCYDEIATGWNSNHGILIENDYINKADVVITTSEILFHSKSSKTKECYLIKNGVDFNRFNMHAANVRNAKRKVIGYTGSIDDRFDIETMKYLIENLPDVEFLFAGRTPDENAFRILSKFSNTRWLGAKKPEEIPVIIGGIDLGIVPYLKNDYTRSVYPLKFNEYLAVGKPVVSSNFADLPEFDSFIHFVSSKESFLNAIREELNTDNEIKKEARIKFASGNSWQKRAEDFSSIIENALERKGFLKSAS